MQFSMSSQIYAPVEEVFAFCTSCTGFEQQFPYAVRWLEADGIWKQNTIVTFKFRFLNLGLFGLWLRYQAEIVELALDQYFVDVMRVGPYKYFRHRHDFAARENMTHYTDTIEFSMGYGALVDLYIGKPILQNIFRQRHRRLKDAMENRQTNSGFTSPASHMPQIRPRYRDSET